MALKSTHRHMVVAMNVNTVLNRLNLINTSIRGISTTSPLNWVIILTRMRVVDNSPIGKQAMLEGRPPKVIAVYTSNRIGKLGDKVMVAIKGEKKRGYVVGCVQRQLPMIPRFDSNNLVLIEDNGNPSGTRVMVPIPNFLRSKGPELQKIIAISSRFV